MSKQAILKNLPSVDELLRDEDLGQLTKGMPRSLVKETVRQVLESLRRKILETPEGDEPEIRKDRVIQDVVSLAKQKAGPHFQRVINASGVVVHTNLGRSLLAPQALEHINALSSHYSNLEFDLDAGRRGSRYSHVEDILKELTGAESALVVNNNAAAVFLVLETLAKGREVVVSRGELVEIGGSFRIPDVMARSGACMVEVGTTNKTHPKDYENAVTEATALFLKVHTSNFRIIGFTQDVPLVDLVKLGQKHGIPVMKDLGSGCFLDLSKYGLTKEPTVQETIRTGVDVATFSGDKLLGGPQAGLILGKKRFVDQVKKNPLNRAVRIDKLTLAALEATLMLYRDEEEARKHIPTVAMITAPLEELNSRAQRLKRRIRNAIPTGIVELAVVDGSSRVGGGALPEMNLPTRLVALTPKDDLSAAKIEDRLRRLPLPVVCRIEQDRILLDVRTILESELVDVCKALESALAPQ